MVRSMPVENRLGKETSPYLLQHKDNPVDWYPWGEEAFARARAEDKPVLLSIGYSACHWCHVIEHATRAFREQGQNVARTVASVREFLAGGNSPAGGPAALEPDQLARAFQ